MNNRDLDIAARTIFGEARGEPREGRIAVAHIIFNRSRRLAFAGPSAGKDGAIAYVCQAPWQFSCWNKGDPNRELLMDMQEFDERLRDPKQIMEGVVLGTIPDPTNGADHYHTIEAPRWAAGWPRWAKQWPPYWAEHMTETARIKGHVFYDSTKRRQAD